MTRFSFLKKIFHSIAGIFLLMVPFKYLFSQSAQSSLDNPILLEKFQQISSSLRCVCGKTMPLNYINDIGYCNAWAMRDVIDGLLLDGFSMKQIQDGFQFGFGEMVANHPVFELTRTKYSHLLDGMKNGYGQEILSNVFLPISIIGLVSFGTTLLGALFFFLKKHIRTFEKNSLESDKNHFSSKETISLDLTEDEQKLLDRLENE